MNNFELDEQAKLLADTSSAYNLAREVLELREKLEQSKKESKDD